MTAKNKSRGPTGSTASKPSKNEHLTQPSPQSSAKDTTHLSTTPQVRLHKTGRQKKREKRSLAAALAKVEPEATEPTTNSTPAQPLSPVKQRNNLSNTNGVPKITAYQDRPVDGLLLSRQAGSKGANIAAGKPVAAITNGVKFHKKSKVNDAGAVVVGEYESGLLSNGISDGHGAPDGHEDTAGHGDDDEQDDDEGDESVYTSGSAEETDEDGMEDSDEGSQSAGRDGEVASDDDAEDEEIPDAHGQASATQEETAEPSFGELISANAAKHIDVEATLNESDAAPNALLPVNGARRLQAPAASSLGTVLTQSLRTNDSSLLESCLYTTDLNIIRGTLERIDSSLAATLLEKLADRLHRRPGRAGNLMVWVQWTLVSHGGYLAGQPQLMDKLNALQRVVKERASGLNSLLLLKGKLDMLEAQVQLRRNMEYSMRLGDAGEDDEDDEHVIYVEGQEEEEDSEEDAVAEHRQSGIHGQSSSKAITNHVQSAEEVEDDADASESDDEVDEMPTTMNGVAEDTDDEDQSESDEGLFDDEAEETDADSGDEDEEDEVELDDEVSETDEDSDSETQAPPAKRPAMTSRTGDPSRRRV